MKFSLKIFLTTYCMLIVALAASSFFLVNRIYTSQLESILERTESDNQRLYTYLLFDEYITMQDEHNRKNLINSITSSMSDAARGYKVSVIDTGILSIYDNSPYGISPQEVQALKNNQAITKIIQQDGIYYAKTISCIGPLYLVNCYSLSFIMDERENNFALYRFSIILLSAGMAVVLFFFSHHVAKPIEELAAMADSVSDQHYSIQIDDSLRHMKSTEVSRLARAMNRLTSHIRKHISELESMVENRETFLANFTHEIKTPLTAMIGYGDMLRTYSLSQEQCRKYGDYIYQEGKRLEHLSHHLLQFFVIGNTRQLLEPASVRDIFYQVKNNARLLEEHYGITISIIWEDAVIPADCFLLATALINFAENSCKASEPGKPVIITGECQDRSYIITVTDQGRGIPKEHLDKVMEPFYMVDKSRSRTQGGAGLGLALCQRIAELHQAQMTITSQPAKGTTVTLSLPMSSETDSPQTKSDKGAL